jgi:hypothetical protein
MNQKTALSHRPLPLTLWAILEIWRAAGAGWRAGPWRWRSRGPRRPAVWGRSFTSTAQLIHYEPSSVDDTYRPRALGTPSLVVMLQAPGILEEVGSHLNPPVSARLLAERLEVTLDRNNDVVTVTATGSSRDESVDIVNRFCAAAIAYTQNLQRQEAARPATT